MFVDVLKKIGKVVLYVLALLFIFVMIAIGYVWWNGQQTREPIETENTGKVESSAVVRRPLKPAANAKPSVAIVYLTTPSLRGTNASINVKTIPTAECTIAVTYGKTASTDSGLVRKTADDRGSVMWTWTIDPGAELGTWPVDIYCYYNKLSAYGRGELEVVRELPIH